MKRRQFGEILLYLLAWLMISILIVGSVFVRITDTDAAHKFTFSTTAGTESAVRLAERLEQNLPDGIRMVKVRPFTYYMFGGDELRNSDVFLISENEIPDYIGWFSPLPAEYDREGAYFEDGVLLGVPCEPDDLDCPVKDGPWYLFLGKDSVHSEDGGNLYLFDEILNGGQV